MGASAQLLLHKMLENIVWGAAQSRPGRGGRPGRAWTLPIGACGHAARADELAQLGASQHHLALRIFVVRGGDAVGAHALAERVGVRRQQLLQPHAIEAAALYLVGIQATA